MPDARVRGIMNLGTKGNTLIGELWRTVAMYRSFPMTVMLTHGMRTMHAGADRVAYGASLFAMMGVAGRNILTLAR